MTEVLCVPSACGWGGSGREPSFRPSPQGFRVGRAGLWAPSSASRRPPVLLSSVTAVTETGLSFRGCPCSALTACLSFPQGLLSCRMDPPEPPAPAVQGKGCFRGGARAEGR